MWKNQSSIQSKFLNKMLFIVFVSVGLWSLIWIYEEYTDFKSQSAVLRLEYIESQKALLKKEVTRVVNYINDMNSRAEQMLEASLKGRVYEAHQIAENIYRQNADAKDLREIGKMIKDALRPIRFNQNRGYYFAVSMDGIDQLYPSKPEFEGLNVLPLKDSQGSYVVQDEIQLVKQQGEGFVKHFWADPEKESTKTYAKLSFVKYFEPLNWYLGSGEYLDASKKQLQTDVLNHLINLRFETEGYFFGSTYQGDSLFSNGKITVGSGNVWNLTDPNGVKIIQEQRKVVENLDGGFVYYSWNKLDTVVASPKVSFVKGIPGWAWTVGAGVYLDTIESTISKNERTLFVGFKKKIIRSFLVLVVLLSLIYFWSKRISKQLQKTVQIFSAFLAKASMESVVINPEHIQLAEFQEIAILTNKMLEDRRKAEIQLKKSEVKYRTLFENMAQGVFYQRADGKIFDFNKNALDMFGLTSDQFLGKTSFDPTWRIVHEDGSDFPGDDHPSIVALTTGKPVLDATAGVFNPIKNDFVWVKINAIPQFKNQESKPYQVFVTLHDITDLRKAEADVRQAHKMESIGILAGGIAHDFNNILSIIVGNAELALSDLPDWNPSSSNLKEIKIASLRAKDVVRQLLSFSRKTEHKQRPLDIIEVTKESINLIRSSIPSSIEIHEKIPEKIDPILADPTQIHQVLINLCTNASHAMADDGGLLEIILRPRVVNKQTAPLVNGLSSGNYVELIVKDSGSGINPKLYDKIFDPYFTTKAVGKGTGMGLAVVHGIVKNHKGEIYLDSELGKGTTITLVFPTIAEHPQQNADPTALPPDPSGKETILFVDDEEALVHMAKKILKKLGYGVEVFTNPVDALDLFKADPTRFDLVISDMTMPQMSGVKLSEKLREVQSDIPIIICTGHSSLIDEDKVKNIGISAFAMKPITMSEIAKLIRSVLDN